MTKSRPRPAPDSPQTLVRSRRSPLNCIYLDYAATTPVAPQVARSMARFLTMDGVFGNPSSITHQFGNAASEAVETARQDIADLIGARPGEVVFTSGATESINLALKGVMLSPKSRGRNLVVSALDHKAVLDTAKWLADSGTELVIMSPDSEGLVTPEVVSAHAHDAALVSVLLVNNETGTITDVPAIAHVAHDAGALLHVDAVQATARMPLDVNTLGADLLSLSAHKMYGPKGVGALYIRRPFQPHLVPHLHGGGQEGGLRAGTLATHQIVGFGDAAKLLSLHLDADMERIRAMDSILLQHLEEIDQCTLNGNAERRIPGILNVAFRRVSSESLMLALPEVALSTGSACTSNSIESSHVLSALGIDERTSLSSIRFSMGRYTTQDDIDCVADRVRGAVAALRRLAE